MTNTELAKRFPELTENQLEFISIGLYEWARSVGHVTSKPEKVDESWGPYFEDGDTHTVWDPELSNKEFMQDIEKILGFEFSGDIGRDT